MNNKVLKIIITMTFLFNFINSTSGQQINQYDNNKFDDSIKLMKLNLNTKITKTDTVTKNENIHYKKHIELKDPKIAFLIASVPGFLVHGSGHLYAGHKNVFKIFLIEEILWITASLFIAYIAPIGDSSSSNSNGDDLWNLWMFLYLGPWAYDMIASPIICKRDNDKKIKSLSINPYMYKNLFGNQIGLKISYRF